MTFLFLAAFIAGLLLGVRVMFFGAERRRLRDGGEMPLRRSEPAIVGFLLMFGVAGYLLTRHGAVSNLAGVAIADTSRARLGRPGHARRCCDRSTAARARSRRPALRAPGACRPGVDSIPSEGEGQIVISDAGTNRTIRARTIDGSAIAEGQEVCIERVEDEVAFVELWAIVEQRLVEVAESRRPRGTALRVAVATGRAGEVRPRGVRRGVVCRTP